MRRHLSRAWWLTVILLLLAALLLTGARLALQSIDRWRPQLEAQLTEALGVSIRMGRLEGQWNYAYPRLEVYQLEADTRAAEGGVGQLQLERLTLELDPFASLLTQSPVFHRFEARGARVRWHQRGGAWLHRPGARPGERGQGMPAQAWERLLALLLRQPYAVIREVELTLVPEQGQSLVITPADLELENARRQHRLSGLFRMPLLGEAAQMSFVIESEAVQQRALDARYRLYLQLEHLGPELFRLFGQQWGIEQLDLNTRIWAQLDQRRLQRLQAEVSVDRLALASAALPYPRQARFAASLQPNGDDYQLQLSGLRLAHEQGEVELPLLMLQGPLAWQPERLQLGVRELDLAAWSHWLRQAPGMPAAAAQLLDELQPGGSLRQLRLHRPAGADWRALQLAADLDRVQLAAWHGAPAVSGVSGRLEAGFKQGRIDLDSDAFSLHFPELYPAPWHYRLARGRVKWQWDEQRLRVASEHLQLRNEQIKAAGRFSLELPRDRSRQSELVLLIGMTDSDGRQAPHYTPEREVGEALHGWLEQALEGGRLRQGGLLLRTGTRHNDTPRSPVVQLFFEVGEGQLAYQPGWPALTEAELFVLVRDGGVAINIDRARLLDSEIRAGWAYLPPGERRLQVEAQVQGPVTDLDHLLKQSPLVERLGTGLADWQLSGGQAQSRLGLAIPLQATAPEVELAVTLAQAQLEGMRSGVRVDDIAGVLRYSSRQGLTADSLRGRFLGRPVSARVSTRDGGYRIDLEGQSSLERLQQWLSLPALALAEGLLPWQARLEICADSRCPRLHLNSDLAGVTLNLPGMLAKSAQQPAALDLTLALAPEVALQTLQMTLPGDGQTPLTLSLSPAAGTAAPTLQLSHPQLSGQLQLADAEQPLRLMLDHLQLKALMPAADAAAAARGAPVDQLSARLPEARVRIRDLWYGDKPLGDWRFNLAPQPGRLRVRELEAYPEQLVVRGEADWVQGEAGNTAVTLKLAGADLGALLKRWGYGQVMETKALDGLLQLQWPGAPWQFALSGLDGEFRFSSGETRLIETADSTNFLRIFGILNFNSLARRLRLDFSDLLKKGVSFDRVSAHYRIEQGVATTLEPLRLQGPSANMSLSGQVDLAAQQLDNRVEVTLPLSSNAPLAAILLGAPQVAGAVFVIDKLIGDRLERFSTLRYRLSGHWDDPQLELQAGD